MVAALCCQAHHLEDHGEESGAGRERTFTLCQSCCNLGSRIFTNAENNPQRGAYCTLSSFHLTVKCREVHPSLHPNPSPLQQLCSVPSDIHQKISHLSNLSLDMSCMCLKCIFCTWFQAQTFDFGEALKHHWVQSSQIMKCFNGIVNAT